MKRILFLLCFFLINNLALSSIGEDRANSFADEITIEEYKVYADALGQLIKSSQTKNVFVIEDHTTPGLYPFDKEIVEYFEKTSGEKLDKAMVRRFQEKNKKSYKLENNFFHNLNIILISKEKMQQIFMEGGGWSEFSKEYPDAHAKVDLSRVAFNDDKTKAFFYFANCFFTGKGYYVLLNKENNRWIVIAEVMAWTS